MPSAVHFRLCIGQLNTDSKCGTLWIGSTTKPGGENKLFFWFVRNFLKTFLRKNATGNNISDTGTLARQKSAFEHSSCQKTFVFLPIRKRFMTYFLQPLSSGWYEFREGNKQLPDLLRKLRLTSDVIALASQLCESCLVSFSYLASKGSTYLPGTADIKSHCFIFSLILCWSNLDVVMWESLLLFWWTHVKCTKIVVKRQTHKFSTLLVHYIHRPTAAGSSDKLPWPPDGSYKMKYQILKPYPFINWIER